MKQKKLPARARHAAPAVDEWERSRQTHGDWGQSMMKEGVFARNEIGFSYVTDSPRETVDLIVRSLPSAVRKRLRPT